MTASIGTYSVGIDGTLSTSPLSNKSDLRYSGSGPDLREIGLIFDYDDLPAKTFSISGEINGVPTGFVVEKFIAKVGENDIDGSFTADLRGKPEVTGFLSSSYIDLASRLETSESESTVVEEQDTGLVFSDEPLDAEWLNAVNMNVEVRTGRLILRHTDVKDFHIGLKIWDGVLDIDPIVFRELDGDVYGKLHLGPQNGAYNLDASLKVENMHVGLLGAEDQPRSTVPPIDGQVEIRGSGRSLHELMASTNGRVAFTQGAGRVKDLITSQLFGDLFLQIIRTLNPLQSAQQYTNLQCAIYRINIEDGLATIENISIQSDRMTVVASGTR